METTFPIGGPRQPVHDALRNRGFVMSNFSDKRWSRADGVEAHVYGTGSRLSLVKDKHRLLDGPMAETLARIDAGDLQH